MTMDAIKQMAEQLGSIPQTPQERRRAKNRRYYERHRHIWHMFNEIRKLRALHALLFGESHAHQ